MTTERSLTSDEEYDVNQYAGSGRRLLSIGECATPSDVLAVLDAFVDGWPRRDPAVVAADLSKPDDLILSWAIGALWGDQVIRQFRWEWIVAAETDSERYGVASPDRALVIYPAYFVRECFYDASKDFTAMLMFNMLLAGRYRAWKANEFADLAECTQRIVPRN
jgi:hypothetical protein